MDLTLLTDPIFLAQNLVDGLARGALYAVYAMGLTLVFGVLDIINLAHAATFMWCAVVGWLVMAGLGWPLAAGLLAAMVTGAGIALMLEYVAFRPLRREGSDRLSTMISSIGMGLILVSVAEAVFGVETRRFPSSVLNPKPFFIGGPGGVRISPAQILIIVASLVLMGTMGWLIRRTRAGMAIRGRGRQRQGRAAAGPARGGGDRPDLRGGRGPGRRGRDPGGACSPTTSSRTWAGRSSCAGWRW